MKRLAIRGALAATLGTTAVAAQAPTGDVLRLDAALDAIVASTAKVEIIKGDQAPQAANVFYFGFLEGPLWVQEGQRGHLLFSDIPANLIYKYTPDGKVSAFLEKAGFTGADANNAGQQANNGRLAILLLGPNGLTLDPQGRLVIAAMADRAVARIEKDGSRTVLADRFEGKRLNGPNDVVVRSDGAVYFTDMTAGMRGGAASPSRELPYTGVYVVKDGQLRLLEKNPQQTNPNGITLSPDEKTLYVNGGRKIWRYDVQPDGNVANMRVIVDMNKETAPGGTDGMKVDQEGNIYCTGPGGVWIMSPDGKHLGTIRTPETVTNLAFGDPDGKTIYMTHRRNLYRIRVNIPGVRPGVRTS
jgi:gluconolactonase